jgi:tetratricopeptide (TPR) repeat protein
MPRQKTKDRRVQEEISASQPRQHPMVGTMTDSHRKLLLLRALLIMAAGFWVFAPALRGDWLWDDDMLIVRNFTLLHGSGLWQIWFSAPETDYWPLTWTFLWLEWHLWGAHPLGYHLCNLGLHLVSALLVWRLWSRLGLRWGWIGGLLFAIHPLAVESVAWISEIKNTLSLPFFLLSLLAYIDEDDQGNSNHLRSLLYYIAAMLCKTSVVMLPIVLLLYCWWKRGRIAWRDLRGTLPYFVVALVLGLVTIYFQGAHIGKIDETGQHWFTTRFFGAGMACSFYLGKFLFPIDLLPIYPRRQPVPFWQMAPSFLIVLSLVFFWTQRKGWGRHLLLGFGFFLINLIPVAGIIRMSYTNSSWVADHLVYLPMIGLIGLAISGIELIEGRISNAMCPLLAGVMAVVLGLLALESHNYAGMFIGPEKLWTYTLAHNPTSWQAHNNLGNVLLETDRLPEAIKQYNESLQFNPNGVEAHTNMGLALDQQGRTPEAIEQYELALKFNPHFALAHINLGNALSKTGRVPEAIEHYKQALLANPNDNDVRANLTKLQSGQKTEPSGGR